MSASDAGLSSVQPRGRLMPQNEVEITPEMIEAGVEALRREATIDCSYSQAWDLAEDVIRRALAAQSK